MLTKAELHYEAYGAGDPVLFIHGFPLSSRLWTPVVERLPPGYRMIIPDLRGFGRTPAAAETSMTSYAVDLEALLHVLSIDRPVVLVGLSMGGYVAFELLRRNPSRVRALVLANTRMAPDTSEQAQGRRATASRLAREGAAFLADDMAGKLFSPRTPEALRSEWREIMPRTPPEGAGAALLAMADRPDSTETLRRFQGPTLVVAGRDDAIIPVSEAEAMVAIASDGRLEIIEDAGHMTPVEQPDRFAALLTEFLQALPGGV
jgi:3-oxoadipate enol-lactonase